MAFVAKAVQGVHRDGSDTYWLFQASLPDQRGHHFVGLATDPRIAGGHLYTVQRWRPRRVHVRGSREEERLVGTVVHIEALSDTLSSEALSETGPASLIGDAPFSSEVPGAVRGEEAEAASSLEELHACFLPASFTGRSVVTWRQYLREHLVPVLKAFHIVPDVDKENDAQLQGHIDVHIDKYERKLQAAQNGLAFFFQSVAESSAPRWVFGGWHRVPKPLRAVNGLWALSRGVDGDDMLVSTGTMAVPAHWLNALVAVQVDASTNGLAVVHSPSQLHLLKQARSTADSPRLRICAPSLTLDSVVGRATGRHDFAAGGDWLSVMLVARLPSEPGADSRTVWLVADAGSGVTVPLELTGAVSRLITRWPPGHATISTRRFALTVSKEGAHALQLTSYDADDLIVDLQDPSILSSATGAPKWTSFDELSDPASTVKQATFECLLLPEAKDNAISQVSTGPLAINQGMDWTKCPHVRVSGEGIARWTRRAIDRFGQTATLDFYCPIRGDDGGGGSGVGGKMELLSRLARLPARRWFTVCGQVLRHAHHGADDARILVTDLLAGSDSIVPDVEGEGRKQRLLRLRRLHSIFEPMLRVPNHQ